VTGVQTCALPISGLLTLNWLVYRQLWPQALGYALLLAAVLGLCFWQWPVIVQWPPGVRAGVLVVLLVLSVLLPGCAGYALVHRQMQRRMLRAVAASRTMGEARALLDRQAVSRARLRVQVAANVLLVAGLWLLVWRRDSATVAHPEVRSPPVAVVAEPAAAPPQQVPSASPMPTPGAGPASTESATPVTPVTPVTATPADVPVPSPPAPAVSTSGPYGINVGLFADPGNGRRAFERLRQVGLPVTLDQVSTSGGLRSRVRVGPFSDRAAADAAAQRIHTLGLEAVVFGG
jgi:cell division septation protein DedD